MTIEYASVDTGGSLTNLDPFVSARYAALAHGSELTQLDRSPGGRVHNRLLSPFVVVDHAGFVATGAMLRQGAAEARKHGFQRVADFGSPFPEPGAVAG
jgi:hypothetical protein